MQPAAVEHKPENEQRGWESSGDAREERAEGLRAAGPRGTGCGGLLRQRAGARAPKHTGRDAPFSRRRDFLFLNVELTFKRLGLFLLFSSPFILLRLAWGSPANRFVSEHGWMRPSVRRQASA